MILTIPGELCDLNKYIKAINGSRWSGNNIKQAETQLVAQIATVSKIPSLSHYPVQLTFRWFMKNRKKDIDNVAFAKKFILDGLVLARILENDSQKFISGFTDEFFIDSKNPRIEVEIVDYDLLK